MGPRMVMMVVRRSRRIMRLGWIYGGSGGGEYIRLLFLRLRTGGKSVSTIVKGKARTDLVEKGDF